MKSHPFLLALFTTALAELSHERTSDPDHASSLPYSVSWHEQYYGNASKYTPMSANQYEGQPLPFGFNETGDAGKIYSYEEALEWVEMLYGPMTNETGLIGRDDPAPVHRYVFAATLGGLTMAGYVMIAGQTWITDIKNACFSKGTRSWDGCLSMASWQVGAMTMASVGSYSGLSTASGATVLQGLQNWVNVFGGVAGLGPLPIPNPGRRAKRQLCPSNIKHDVDLGGVTVAFGNANYGVKASCTTPCQNNPTWDPHTLSWLASQAADVMFAQGSSQMEATLYYNIGKEVWMRCHTELELDMVDTCPNEIDGGNGCYYQGS